MDTDVIKAKLALQHPRYRNWEAFKIFESELIVISRHISICKSNYYTKSAELSSLILRICSEIEIIRKRMTGTKKNNDACSALVLLYPDVASTKARLPLWSFEFLPWRQLPSGTPEWWSAYNQIKHDEIGSDLFGNLKYFLQARAALYLLLIFYDRFVYSSKDSQNNDVLNIDNDFVKSLYFIPESPSLTIEHTYYGNIPFIRWT